MKIRDLALQAFDVPGKVDLARKIDWLYGLASAIGGEIAGAVAAIELPQGVPEGGKFIAMFAGNCPAGWTRVSALDGKFPRGAATYGGTGGASSHAHAGPDPHTHGLGSYSTGSVGTHGHGYTSYTGASRATGATGASIGTTTASTGSAGGHTHGFSGLSGTGGAAIGSSSNLPPYREVVYCSKD